MAIPTFYKGADFNNQRLTSLSDPSAASDATTKQYVDNKIDGLSYKDEVKVATTANLTLSTGFAAGQVIDGYTLVTGDRILVKDQTTGSENGIRIVGAGTPARATDADSPNDLNNATVYVTNGTVNGGREYTQTAKNPTVDTTALVFAQKTTGTAYTADGNGLTLSGQQFSLTLDGSSLSKSASGLRIADAAAGAGLVSASGILAVGAGTGITVNADDVAINTAVVTRKAAFDSTAASASQSYTHGLGTADLQVAIWRVSDQSLVYADVVRSSTTVTVDYGFTPTAGQFRVVVQG